MTALLPVFGLIVLGAVLARIGPLSDDGWRAIEQITYWLLLPALLVLKLGGTDLSGYSIGPMVVAMSGAILIVAALLLAIRRLTGIAGPAYTSVIQGAIRQNTYIGVGSVGALYGQSGEALAAVGIAAVIPLVNTLSIWVLTRMAGRETVSGLKLLWAILTNPIFVACALGIALNATGIGIHPILAEGLDKLAGAALALGLLAVGAGLRFGVLKTGWPALLLSNAVKLVGLPLLTIALAAPLGVTGTALAVAVLFNALPSSASAYVFARQLGGDHELMAAILTTQVIMAAITLPTMLAMV
ncbi:MAG: AEC family transporter [Alphaproteobacteria bacterium]|nr:AEC family transporter [Alphaproteobacteria bacterium]